LADTISVFFVGDIVGTPGIEITNTLLPSLIKKYSADFVIANAENSHEGFGTNRSIIKNLLGLGVHVVTGGDHSFDKWKVFDYMREHDHILRPLNYPKGNAGLGYGIYLIPGKDVKFGVLNLQGRTFMKAIDDPFSAAEWALDKIREETPLIFVDFHAEATAEKISLGWHIDGKASVMVGTHTHVQTNDARILPQGLGFLSDAGMTGSFNSVIGMDKKVSIKRFMTGVHQKYQAAKGDNRICGVFSKIDTATGKCVHIEPVTYPALQHSVTD
jgi:metallophosphoesterase (TIGR00282 family)